MKKNKMNTLPNNKIMPEKIRNHFIVTNRQLPKFGNSIFAAEFSFLFNIAILSTPFQKINEVERQKRLEDIYKLMPEDKDFIDDRIKEIENNYSEFTNDLYKQGIVSLWSDIESFIKKLGELIYIENRSIVQPNKLEKVKIPISDIFYFDESEQPEHFAKLIFDSLDYNRKIGIDKFNQYLSVFGIEDITLKPEFTTDLLLLYVYRNCIVHNSSKLDERSINIAGFDNRKMNEKIQINREEFCRFEKACCGYVFSIYYGLNKKIGASEGFLKKLKDFQSVQ